MTGETYWVALFKSVSYALMAEKILLREGIPFKLIPVPKEISADCGVCLRFMPGAREKILQALADRVEIANIRPLE
jgi:hypothetical protein